MIFDEFSLKGKVAIVTGAGRGIGKAISLALAEAGADIVVAARTQEEIEETCREVKALGRQSLAVPTDVTKAGQVDRMVEEAISHFKKIDILVNNAGILISKAVVSLDGERLTKEEWHEVLDTNLTSVVLCCRAVGPHMFKWKKGKVINISSVNARKGSGTGLISYNASKAGLSMFTRCLALEWAPFNINVNAIGPGEVYTKLSARYHEDPESRAKMMTHLPLGRVGDVREIALLAVYLASPASDFITGQTIFIDGGESVFSP